MNKSPKPIIKQYEVWEIHRGKPRPVKVEAAIGLRSVKIKGKWHNREDWFNTKEECQKTIDRINQYQTTDTWVIDPMFIPDALQE